MSLGLLARADSGGLGALTWDFAQELRPARIIVVDLGPQSRGPSAPERYEGLGAEVVIARYPLLDPGPLLDGLSCLYTAEVPYGPRVLEEARRRGVRVILHAMTELWQDAYAEAAEVWLPTRWSPERVEAACAAAGTPLRHVPVPVPASRIASRERSELRSALHIAAPAMLDRNGTELVAAAYGLGLELPELRARFVPPVLCARYGWQPAPANASHYEGWSSADLLVMPRRYAGLSLPVQEAAAAGVPALMLAREPEQSWPGVACVPAWQSSTARMAGGDFPLYACSPEALAGELQALAAEPARLQELSRQAQAWARARSWEALLPLYRELLS